VFRVQIDAYRGMIPMINRNLIDSYTETLVDSRTKALTTPCC